MLTKLLFGGAKKGFAFLGIEREPDYVAIAQARVAHTQAKQPAGLHVVKPARRKAKHIHHVSDDAPQQAPLFA